VPNPVLQRLVDERRSINENIDRILDSANDEERDPTDSERELITRHRDRLQEIEPQIGELIDLEESREAQRDARATLERRRETPPDGGNGDDDDGGDGDEPGEYRRFAHYARDAILCRFDRIGAQVPAHVRQRAAQRLERAVSPVLVADVGPFVSPTYIAEIMQTINRARPLVAASRQVALSSGKVQFPQITTRPQVAKQATEKTEAGDGSMTVDLLETLADTYLVAANFSWQVIQWSNPDALALWFDLAATDYAKKTDAAAGAVLAAADSTPVVAGIAPLDLAEVMGAIASAAAEVYANTGRYVNGIAMNPADAYSLVALVGNVNPTFLATGTADLSNGTWPSIAGLRLIVSSGIPAKTAIVGDFSALLCAETPSAPVELRAVEPSIGGLEVGIIGAFACAVTDPGAFAELTLP